MQHLRELKTLVTELLGDSNTPALNTNVSKQFSLENGAAQLAKSFSRVARFDLDDALVVTMVEPLVAYIKSGFMGKQLLRVDHEESLRQFIADRMARDGAFCITKSTGLFVATG